MIAYKFLPPSRIDVLQNLSIRFTQPYFFNDPFEVSPIFNSLVNSDKYDQWFEESVLANFSVENVLDSKREEIRNAFGFILALNPGNEQAFEELLSSFKFVIDKRKFFNASKKLLKPIFILSNKDQREMMNSAVALELGRTFGILSLSKSIDNELMWAHYCESYNGFAIGFDSTHNWFDRKISPNDRIRQLVNVNYVTDFVKFDGYDPDNEEQSQRFMSDIFHTKSSKWEYENEIRMILPLDRVENFINSDVYLEPFPPEMIKEIIFGLRAQDSLIELVHNILSNYGITVDYFKIDKSTMEYKLILTKLNL